MKFYLSSMAHLLIFIADDGTAIKLRFELNDQLNGIYYGIWQTSTNYVELSTEAWEFYQHNIGNAEKLKPMMEKLFKYEIYRPFNASGYFLGLAKRLREQ